MDLAYTRILLWSIYCSFEGHRHEHSYEHKYSTVLRRLGSVEQAEAALLDRMYRGWMAAHGRRVDLYSTNSVIVR